ncbi:ATP-binding protein [Desulforhopalus sp. IMCC35007]|uniref:hybrid sensor histidine kinase/response regulator n=1 Tax=Desulforhopalus sp. IMCC35007 TaxID=2569543 RepID=UPI0010ADC8EE|nr:ATP-binding protein [Desulforhopalus sp. IMCC35007]TKB05951.1 response regulator [Desulforhopalus sp. IMCC35007]
MNNNLDNISPPTQSSVSPQNKRKDSLSLGRAEQLNQTLFKISNAVRISKNLEALYGSIHHILGEIMDLTNFFIALYHKENQRISFPYFRDIYDDENVYCDELQLDNCLTGGVIQNATPVFLRKDELERRRDSKTLIGTVPELWLGVPLKIKDEVIGVMATLSYHDAELFDEVDLNTLISVSDQIALAIERKQYEQALISSEKKYRTILETMVEGYFEQDQKGIITLANPAMCRIFDKPVEKVVGTSFKVFLENPETNEINNKFQDIFDAQINTLNIEFDLILSNDSIRYLEGTFSSIPGDSNVIAGIKGIVRDITEKKKAERTQKALEEKLQQSQRLESLGTLAGGVAHDFNNLLMGIQGRISIIRADLEEQHPHSTQLELMESYIQRASTLTSQLLGFARGGKYELKAVSINHVITNSIDIVQPAIKAIEIRTVLNDHLNAVEVDENQMEQVFVNLLLNASKAMEQGGTITIATEQIMVDANGAEVKVIKPGDYVQITVKDTGRGIRKDDIEKVFDPFFTTDSLGGSSGLGLAMVYGIIENHQGFISVESTEGEGTCFTILLPSSEKEIVSEVKPAIDTQTGTDTILLVDDEPMITEVGKEMISMLGYDVITASSGMEALEIVGTQKKKIDLFIIDMIMPQMSGGELFDKLKSLDPDIKIMLSSGYSLDGEAREIMNRGCRGFIQKPFTVSQLGEKIRDVLGTDEELNFKSRHNS